ncbi:FAD/NAD(P)-binding domain-containing protein [Tothia fuscella]|uniref:FAD/NAD(P)-binding domain-containing protein n=1 Tax=Tothia fuscella TaxID=1048955 RepID=A0A9P4TTS3_9PEZI|nr:FAD/NAD(P)-binding domain-containing protein [Tothia fuscella]
MAFVLKSLILGLALNTVAQGDAPQGGWDIIVVGAGPAGIIVADRMSEAGKKTLLIEGGGPSYGITGGTDAPDWLKGEQNVSRVDVPGLYKSIFADQGKLTCQNETNAFGGCTIGGSSAINAGLFFQPPASDYDLYHAEGWKYKDVKPSIDKVYAKVPNTDIYSEDKKLYLQSGYDAARKWLVDGANYTNVNINDQANNKEKVFGRPIFDYDNGQRGGPATTYLQDALKRNNFKLVINTRVKRIDRTGGLANGVTATVNSTDVTYKLNPNGRVILSGGALQSPQLLMFSGIGDPAIRSNLTAGGMLKDVTQPWINNTAVGDGLFDNPNTFIEFEGSTIESYVYNYTDPIEADAKLWLDSRSGPYSFASETSSFWDIIKHSDGSQTGVQGTIDSAGFGTYTSNQTITLNIYGTSGLKSRGKVVFNEKFQPGASPETYYSDPRDADDIATFIFSIFQKLDASLLKPLNIPLNSTKNEIRDYITSSTDYTRGQVNHWSSSCRIGSCVDVNAQVVGTNNIHVVDGSIVEPLTVNPQFGIMIAAERASELILKLNEPPCED